jgi:pimeloyl-ACP methyl ester carboxylesterase
MLPAKPLLVADEAVTVRVPTTVLWGDADTALRPGLLRGLERWVPQLDLRVVPGASHWIVHEQPERVAQTIRELLQQP